MKAIFLRRALFVLVLAFVFLSMQARAEDGIGETYTVFVSVEGFTLGHGFYVAPTAVAVPAGESVWDATVSFFEQVGIEFDVTPWGGLDRVHGIHPNGGSVGSFDYTGEAGWMFTLNHYMPSVGAADMEVSDKDVIRWQFSIEGWGADLGLGPEQGFWMEPPVRHADETEAIRMLFAENADAETVALVLDGILNAWNKAVLLADWVNPFVDADESDWFFEYMRLVNFHRIMIGVPGNRFSPDTAVSLAQAVTMLWRLNDEPAVSVQGTAWYAPAAAWAQVADADLNRRVTQLEFAELFGLAQSGTFVFSNENITRAEAAEVIAMYFLKV
jgi:hypothetical protein